MKNISIFIIFVLSKTVAAQDTTNLATINTIRNGFATVNECQRCYKDEPCFDDSFKMLLEEDLELATIGQCIASLEDYKKEGMDVPKCPEDLNDIKGLDNTHPSGGIFALYTGDNSLFLKDLISNYFKNDKAGKFNLVLPREHVEALKKEPALVKLFNSKRVNIVYVETMPSVGRWMQDSFQFTTIDAKPALYQLEHARESEQKIEMRLACKLARNCDIPYYIPPDMVDPYNSDYDSLNSGGNLEVLPDGTFLSGVKKYRYPDGEEIIVERTHFQEIQRKSLEKSGNRVLEIDTSFLRVGHVDEMVNFVKTDKPAPCDFAVMMASPKKAFELLEKAARDKESIVNWVNPWSFFVGSAYASLAIVPSIPCYQYAERKLELRSINHPVSENEMAEMKKDKCIDGMTVQSFVRSRMYSIIKNRNMDAWNNSTKWQEEDGEWKEVAIRKPSANHILGENRDLIIEELKKSTRCENPSVVEIPVFFRNRLSFTPNLVNGVVQTPPGGASSVILPRSYFEPFDDYVKEELSKYGVNTTFVHDLGYHLNQGEVHCGTNSARICRP